MITPLSRNRYTKILTIFTLLCLFVSSAGLRGGLQVAFAQEDQPETPIATSTPAETDPTPEKPTATPTETLPFTPSVDLTPTAEILTSLDLSMAGMGTLFRARVQVKQPGDLARLNEWGIIVLESGADFAFVQVDEGQLAKLARLGFQPGQIDSLHYLALVYNALEVGEEITSDDLANSFSFLMELSSVDTDSDGLTDTEESWWCTNPNDNNSDSPEPPSQTNPSDGDEVAAIKRGITAYGPPFALWPQFTPYNSNGTCPDGDYDGAPDYAEEFVLGTSNLRESSDKDKFDDGQELFGVTFCPAPSGPCGYGILPRAEDAAFVSANLPSWVLPPGNSPFVAAFPEPEVEVEPSSLRLTQVTIITNTNGTSVGTEKTYGTSKTKGTSTSEANTETWNSWEEVMNTTASGIDASQVREMWSDQEETINSSALSAFVPGLLFDELIIGPQLDNLAGETPRPIKIYNNRYNIIDSYMAASESTYGWDSDRNLLQNLMKKAKCSLLPPYCVGEFLYKFNQDLYIRNQATNTNNEDLVTTGGDIINKEGDIITFQPQIGVSYPAPIFFTPTTSISHGSERGGAHTITYSEYEEQTISESSTEQFSEDWSQSVATDTSHAADLRFTYNIVNNGTEYAREISSLTFNIYIGNDPSPAYTYVAVGSTGQIDIIENLFPGDELTYTSDPIALTLDEMRAIDEGAPVRVVMEDISFGQDQVFYQDAMNGSVLVAMEDGYDDFDEVVDSYLIPVWDPSDTVQDVIKRYFPVIEDTDGNLLSIFSPESSSSIPALCEQDTSIAPGSNTQVFCKHALTGTSWWNIYLSDGLDYTGVFNTTLAAPNTSMLVRIVSDRDLDGYNDRNEIRLGTDPDDPVSHPSPVLVAGYTKSCSGDDCTLRMSFENLGDYDAYGVEAILYSPDGLVEITNNTIGGSGRVAAGGKVVVSENDTFQYTILDAGYAKPVIVVSYNDPQGNHRFILPETALLSDLNDDLTSLNGQMLPDPGVDISSTSADQANFVIFSPHPADITDGNLFVEYIDGNGNVLNEDVFTQAYLSGPTVVPVTVDTVTYPSEDTILLAFFTDSQGNIIDSSARPLASFGPDPLPVANLTNSDWIIGEQMSAMSVDDPWDFGTVEPGTTLYAHLTLGNTGLGTLRYTLSGAGNGLTVTGIPAGDLGPSETQRFSITLDTAGMPPGPFNRTLTMRTSDPNHASIPINITGIIGTSAGTATAYQISPFRAWDQYIYVEGPHNQNDMVEFTHTLPDDPSRMFPLYLYDEEGATLKGVGEYGVDFSGQTAPFGVFGTGADQDLMVNGEDTEYTDDTRAPVSATAAGGQPNITLSYVTGFAAGQEVLVMQVQGTGAGLYEFGTIASIASNTLTLSKNLTHTYTVGGNSKAQVIRVMNYHDVTVQSGGILTAHAWDGNTGGILVFRASGVISILSGGVVDVSGKGFRGGIMPDSGWSNPGYSGESHPGPSLKIAYPNGGGGGGGCDYQNAGGSGGSYGTEGTNGGGNQCANDHKMGFVYGEPTLSTIFLGSGGGSAGGAGADGGAGGGAVLLIGREILIAGNVKSNGANGQNGGESGAAGGSGGSIKIIGQTINVGTNLVIASGGSGGSGTVIYGGQHADGGIGGLGRIRIEYGTLSGTTNPAASTQQVSYYNITGQSAPFGVFGNGSNGNLTVASGETEYTDDISAALAATASAGQAYITLSDATDFSAGQEVLVIQSQGMGAGSYEFAVIVGINGSTLSLHRNLVNTYTNGGGSKAQIIVVPNYLNVTVQSGGILTAHAWNGNTGGILAFRVSETAWVETGGYINMSGLGFAGGSPSDVAAGEQGDSATGNGINSTLSNGTGGGGGALGDGAAAGGGGGGGLGTTGVTGQPGARGGGQGGNIGGSADLSSLQFGGAGGAGGTRDRENTSGGIGGSSGGIIFVGAKIFIADTSSYILANGNPGGAYVGTESSGGGGGGAGGSILLKADALTISTSMFTTTGGGGGAGKPGSNNDGGSGGIGRIRIEYGTLIGSAPASASVSQVNYYNMTGSVTNELYLPDSILAGEYIRYQLLYGQRSLSTDSGDQLFSVRVPDRMYSRLTLNALLERVVGSGSTFDFCLDLGNDASCDWNASNQPFSEPVRLDSPNLAGVLNAYIQSLGSTQETVVIPIRVNISTPADIFLFNLSGLPGQDVDLEPTGLTLTPQNGAQPDNIGEGTLVYVSAAITNNGTHIAENFTVGFYQGDPAGDGTLIGSTFIESLAAGATSPVQIVVWNTAGLTPGDYNIYVKADASSAISESDESNNVTSSPAVVKKKPDLVVTALSAPDLRQNEEGTANVTIKNEGEADVIGALVSLFKGSDDTGTLLGSTNVDVPEGQTVIGQIAFSIAEAGSQPLYVKVDPDDTVLEADENNNSGASSVQIGWEMLTVDAGGGNDTAFSSSAGYGWLTQGSVVTTCGTAIEKSFRQAGSAEALEYRFDNLLPGRYYHLDLTFATCSGDRYVNIYVDGKQVFESGQMPAQTAQITSDPHTLSILLDPSDYTDGSVILSIQRASGLSGPLVNIIDLQEVRYCYRDSGPGETPWSAESGCGYDPTGTSDGFNGWGSSVAETIRFDEGGAVPYKLTGLDPARIYDLRLTFYEEDAVGRVERLLYDGSPSLSYTLNSSIQKVVEVLPQASYADGGVNVVIERTGGGDAIVSEVTLEENTRAQNGRYPVPETLVPPTPTPTPNPTTDPVVVLSSFTAAWNGAQINVQWATTTEINNSTFKLYRSPDALAWTEIASANSTRPCGNYTGTEPVFYNYVDTDVTQGQVYYYRLGFSGQTCATGFVAMESILMVEPITHSISLVAGWNLISFNIHPTDTTPATVLSSVAGNYDLVYAWDASGAHAGSGNWMKYDPAVPPFVNTLGSLDERMGFWIHMTAPDTLDVTGTLPTTLEVDLLVSAGGWNLVAYPSVVNRALPDALSENGVGADFNLVYAYHASDTGDPWKLFDRTVPVFVNDLKELTPGWGYWIMVSADHTWSVDYQPSQ